MKYLSAEDILAIHDRVIEETGGSLGVREHGLLQSIAQRPRTAFAGEERFPDVLAAAYLESIATYHVFLDGNRRTAISTAGVFLALNGYKTAFPVEQSESFMLDVAQKQRSFEEIRVWLQACSKPLKKT